MASRPVNILNPTAGFLPVQTADSRVLDGNGVNPAKLHGGTIRVRPSGASVAYLPAADTDAARGTALLAANAAAVAGDVVRPGPGTHDLGAGRLVMVAGVSIVGAGMNATVVRSSVPLSVGGVVGPASGCRIADLTVEAYGTSENGYHAAIGHSSGPVTYTDVRVERVKLVADSDGFYGSYITDSSIEFVDCWFSTKYDCVIVANTGNVIRLRRCRLDVDGSTTLTGDLYTQAVVVTAGDPVVYLDGCDLNVRGNQIARAIYIPEVSTITGRVHVRDTRITSSGSFSAADLSNDGPSGAAALHVSGGVGSGTGGAYTLGPTTAVTYTEAGGAFARLATATTFASTVRATAIGVGTDPAFPVHVVGSNPAFVYDNTGGVGTFPQFILRNGGVDKSFWYWDQANLRTVFWSGGSGGGEILFRTTSAPAAVLISDLGNMTVGAGWVLARMGLFSETPNQYDGRVFRARSSFETTLYWVDLLADAGAGFISWRWRTSDNGTERDCMTLDRGQVRVHNSLHIGNAPSEPAASASGGVLYCEAGVLKFKGPDGVERTVTVV